MSSSGKPLNEYTLIRSYIKTREAARRPSRRSRLAVVHRFPFPDFKPKDCFSDVRKLEIERSSAKSFILRTSYDQSHFTYFNPFIKHYAFSSPGWVNGEFHCEVEICRWDNQVFKKAFQFNEKSFPVFAGQYLTDFNTDDLALIKATPSAFTWKMFHNYYLQVSDKAGTYCDVGVDNFEGTNERYNFSASTQEAFFKKFATWVGYDCESKKPVDEADRPKFFVKFFDEMIFELSNIHGDILNLFKTATSKRLSPPEEALLLSNLGEFHGPYLDFMFGAILDPLALSEHNQQVPSAWQVVLRKLTALRSFFKSGNATLRELKESLLTEKDIRDLNKIKKRDLVVEREKPMKKVAKKAAPKVKDELDDKRIYNNIRGIFELFVDRALLKTHVKTLGPKIEAVLKENEQTLEQIQKHKEAGLIWRDRTHTKYLFNDFIRIFDPEFWAVDKSGRTIAHSGDEDEIRIVASSSKNWLLIKQRGTVSVDKATGKQTEQPYLKDQEIEKISLDGRDLISFVGRKAGGQVAPGDDPRDFEVQTLSVSHVKKTPDHRIVLEEKVIGEVSDRDGYNMALYLASSNDISCCLLDLDADRDMMIVVYDLRNGNSKKEFKVKELFPKDKADEKDKPKSKKLSKPARGQPQDQKPEIELDEEEKKENTGKLNPPKDQSRSSDEDSEEGSDENKWEDDGGSDVEDDVDEGSLEEEGTRVEQLKVVDNNVFALAHTPMKDRRLYWFKWNNQTLELVASKVFTHDMSLNEYRGDEGDSDDSGRSYESYEDGLRFDIAYFKHRGVICAVYFWSDFRYELLCLRKKTIYSCGPNRKGHHLKGDLAKLSTTHSLENFDWDPASNRFIIVAKANKLPSKKDQKHSTKKHRELEANSEEACPNHEEDEARKAAASSGSKFYIIEMKVVF